MENQKVQRQQILLELTILDSCCRGQDLSPDELENLSDRWFKIININFVSYGVFRDAVLMFQASNPWFPQVSDILENIKAVNESRRRNQKALPEPDIIPPTPEEMAENRKRLKEIFKTIGGTTRKRGRNNETVKI